MKLTKCFHVNCRILQTVWYFSWEYGKGSEKWKTALCARSMFVIEKHFGTAGRVSTYICRLTEWPFLFIFIKFKSLGKKLFSIQFNFPFHHLIICTLLPDPSYNYICFRVSRHVRHMCFRVMLVVMHNDGFVSRTFSISLDWIDCAPFIIVQVIIFEHYR